MSDLDSRLRDIFENCFGVTVSGEFVSNEDEAVKDIKQAFMDDGWAAIPEKEVYDRVLKYDNQTVCSTCSNRFSSWEDCIAHQKSHDPTMTGEEWFDKFQEAYTTWDGFISKEYNDGYADSRMKALDAAKKAAGIE